MKITLGTAGMKQLWEQLNRTLRRFRDDTSGGLSVEYVMWVPLMAAGMVLTTDITILMREQSYLFVIARDTSRLVAVRQHEPEKAAEIMTQALSGGNTYTIESRIDGLFVTSQVTVPYRDVLVFGSMFSGDGKLSGAVSMVVEGTDLGA